MTKKVILIIRDGWGYKKNSFSLKNFFSKKKVFNAIKNANTPNTDFFEKKYPNIFLEASGEYVGLPKNFVGNSEVGHITMGLGKIQDQFLLKINKEIKSQNFLTNPNIFKAIKNVKEKKTRLHLAILMQDAGVHSDIYHLYETLKYAKKEGLKNDEVILHLFCDGRDSEPKSAVAFLENIGKFMFEEKVANVGSISGRFFAMDRNKNEERTKKSFDAIWKGKSEKEKFSCGVDALFEQYEKKITDEFIIPIVKKGYEGVEKNDSFIFLNFRKDRAIQLSQKISQKFLENKNPNFYTMVCYDKNIISKNIFDDLKIEETLGDFLEKKDKKQLRISETEKYAHVTYFFDGGVKKKHTKKEEILIKSSNIKSYQNQPEMEIEKITQKIKEKISENSFDFLVLNLPNADMVAHTGNVEATKKAVEILDKKVKEIADCGLENNYISILTADHGNAEEISEEKKSHTKNKVPFTIVGKDFEDKKNIFKKGNFGLANIYNTILEIMDLEKNPKKEPSLFKEK